MQDLIRVCRVIKRFKNKKRACTFIRYSRVVIFWCHNISFQFLKSFLGDTRQDEVADSQRFSEWRASLAVLGIPFMDVVRVLAAILLIGNVQFAPRSVVYL